jgi:hypothetical protein
MRGGYLCRSYYSVLRLVHQSSEEVSLGAPIPREPRNGLCSTTSTESVLFVGKLQKELIKPYGFQAIAN